METRHQLSVGDARELEAIPSASVELVVTSPPYPMIELWDELFAELDPSIETALANGEGDIACERMHAILDEVWAEVERVLIDGGVACINIGDATRTLGDKGFRRYANHARITQAFVELDFVPLPTVHWHKPTNAATKFMGSGMLPPNAYVTQEHEQILIFRKGQTPRTLEPGAERRYGAAYFWEERNRWFSDRWTDVGGRSQTLEGDHDRERAAAFPVTIPYRLIAMYSVYGDTVLDPFWGTGTTTLAAMAAARNSIGVELDPTLRSRFNERVASAPELSETIGQERLEAHHAFVERERADGGSFAYHCDPLDVPVKTAQEEAMQLFVIESMREEGSTYRVKHRPLDPTD